MEALAVLLVLGLFVVVFVLPIFAAVRASKAAQKVAEFEWRLVKTETELANLRASVRKETEPTSARETARETRQPAAPTSPAPDAAMEPSRTVPALPAEAVPSLSSATGPVPSTAPPKLEPLPVPPPLLTPQPVLSTAGPPTADLRIPERKWVLPTIDWEQFMGVKLFAWLGGLALFLAAAYFVKYSFENNLIPPEVRVALGFLLGIGLVVGGVVMDKRRYRVTAHSLCGTGVVILYAVSFACHAVYKFAFFGQVPTFLLMTLITATAFLMSVRLNAQVISLLGILGGFLTPILLSTGQDNPVGLFSYIALLDLGLIAVALRQRWSYLPLLGALGTAIMQIGWAAKFFAVSKVYTAVFVLLGFDVLFLVTLWWAVRRDQADEYLAAAAGGMSLVTFGFVFYFLGFAELGARPSTVFTVVLGADLCLLALAFLQSRFAAIQLVSGGLAFLALATWTGRHLEPDLLNWALGMSFLFAVLHSAYPLALQKYRPGTAPVWWAHAFPPLALVLMLLPMFRLTELSFLVWPAVLLVDAVAILLAVVTLSLGSIVIVLLLTLASVFLWLVRTPVEAISSLGALGVIGGFALFFFFVGWYATKKVQTNEGSDAGPFAESGVPAFLKWTGDLLPLDVRAQIPALSAVMPFLLLMMVVLRLPLTNPSPVFGLALLLVVLLLALTQTLKLPPLSAVALVCMLALEHVWHFQRVLPGGSFSSVESISPLVTLVWYVGFAAIFVAFPFVTARALAGRALLWAVGALSAPLHFYLVHTLVRQHYSENLSGFMGLLPAGFAAPMLVCLAVLVKRFPPGHEERNTVLAWFGGAALFFVTLIFPIQFDRQWITIGWALEGAALCWLFHRVPHPGLRLVGVALLVVAFARLALNPEVYSYQPRSATPILNWYLYAYGIVTVCLFAAARLLAPPRHEVLGRDARPILLALGTVLAFLLLNLEIADYFTAPGQATLAFKFSGNFARDMTYSIAWALFALGLVIAGLLRRLPAARYAGIALLGVTLLKLFFHDLAELRQLYRVGTLFGVAVIAFVASFLYQRFLSAPTQSHERPPQDPTSP